jgi:hypothetical protein
MGERGILRLPGDGEPSPGPAERSVMLSRLGVAVLPGATVAGRRLTGRESDGSQGCFRLASLPALLAKAVVVLADQFIQIVQRRVQLSRGDLAQKGGGLAVCSLNRVAKME